MLITNNVKNLPGLIVSIPIQKNSADMNDTIVVPRTIFKGYLGIMLGTTLVTLGGLINKSTHPKAFKSTMATGLISSLYGTWAFVRPFIVKDAPGVSKHK